MRKLRFVNSVHDYPGRMLWGGGDMEGNVQDHQPLIKVSFSYLQNKCLRSHEEGVLTPAVFMASVMSLTRLGRRACVLSMAITPGLCSQNLVGAD